jgi:hypothetical protein
MLRKLAEKHEMTDNACISEAILRWYEEEFGK